MKTPLEILSIYIPGEEAEAITEQASGLSNEEIGKKWGVTGEWVRRLANRGRQRLEIPEIRRALVSQLSQIIPGLPSYYAPGSVIAPLLGAGERNRTTEIMEIAPDEPEFLREIDSWGMQIVTEDYLKRLRELDMDAEAAILRRVKAKTSAPEADEILSEEIMDLV